MTNARISELLSWMRSPRRTAAGGPPPPAAPAAPCAAAPPLAAGRRPEPGAPLELVARDPYLSLHEPVMRRRLAAIGDRERQLRGNLPSLAEFAAGHEYFGLHRTADGWVFREWAPHAEAIWLVGDFSDWEERPAFRLERRDHGVWELSLSATAVRHGQHYQLRLRWPGGGGQRLPAWGRRMVQDEQTKIFTAQVWAPEQPYLWRNPEFRRDPQTPPLIYEAHIGMAQEEGKVGSYREFELAVLPRIVKAGYNTLQLMAIQEHPYYGSFGYHVTNFFATSSRFGTPEELKSLIDAAHGAGLAVIMDLIHSHAAKNEAEGLSRFDGTPYQFFHAGPRGDHLHWDSRCFDYGKPEVLHFLISNCRYWLDEFRFDGFRFDGITSMLYLDHGIGRPFTEYGQYFDDNVDDDALAYLALANQVIHELRPDALTVAEDVSGMPGLAAPPEHGGFGFDYRLAMGVPDYWIKLLKEVRDEEWPLGTLWHEVNNRRPDEKTVSYVESHDQAIVGDKTTISWLLDKEIYTGMSVLSPPSLVVARGLALHKMMRLLTLATAGGAWLDFMGNEFGHPEWIDFPRAGNNWSYHYARRQWHLRDDRLLKYHFLGDFSAAMLALAADSRLLDPACAVHLIRHDEGDRVLAFTRGPYLFAFNFSPERSYTDYGFEVLPGKYTQALDTDAKEFGGFGRLAAGQEHFTRPLAADRHQLLLYLPSRSAQVLRRA
ncbi:MAG: alpha amylase C-terminal domain-containing protein [Lentisphaeria bacterium]|jgi:1,4-alpha-glucan branching enzyme